MAAAYGARAATISAFPTYLMVTMGRGEPAAVELTTSLGGSLRLDQIAALDHLLQDAERGAVRPADGLRQAGRDPPAPSSLRASAEHCRLRRSDDGICA